jgi:CelD/BcsL family acetyltransferase involved in cellulose biosynthesis
MRDIVRLLRTTAELEEFVPAWRTLWHADPHATPFQHPAWLMPWWKQFGQRELRAVVLCRDEQPIGLVPLYIYEEPQTGERKLMPLGVGTTDYLDGVFRPACSAGEIRRALDVLAADAGWDAMYAPQLRAGSRLAEALAGRPAAEPFAGDPCWRMPAVPVAELPPKLRKNVAYYCKRAERERELTLEIADRAAAPRLFDDLVRQHTARWQQAGEPGVLADPRVLAWHRDAIPQLADAGLLRLYSLGRGGERLAVIYAVADPPGRAARSLYVYITSYSVEHAAVAPGTLLLALAVEHAAGEGIQIVDMLRGNESYKRLWHMEQGATIGYRVPHPGLAPALAA